MHFRLPTRNPSFVGSGANIRFATYRTSVVATATALAASTIIFFSPVFAATPQAALIRQNLIPAKSKASFTIESPLLQFDARVSDLTGFIDLDPRDITRSRVELRTNLSRLKVDASNAPFDLEQLFAAIPSAELSFVSSAIAPVSAGKYRVSGTVRRGARTWPAHLVVNYTAPSSSRSIVTVEKSGPIEESVPESPIPITPGTTGSVSCALTFQTQSLTQGTANKP